MLTGGIDLGGTKIEARLFDSAWQTVESRRIATPQSSYAKLLDGLADQIGWLERTADDPELSVGVGAPGIVDRDTGTVLTANLPASGQTLPTDIATRTGRPVPWIKDCTAFALAEARYGAGRGHRTVLGLILGTGVSGGLVRDGIPLQGPNDLAGEYGQMPLPATLVEQHGLPLLPDGIGSTGCYETLCSGPGLTRLAELRLGKAMSPVEIAEAGQDGAEVLDLWARIVGEMLGSLMLATDPDCVVLGGGLSNLPDVTDLIARGTEPTRLPGTRLPRFVLADDPDGAGARGAAMIAREVAG